MNKLATIVFFSLLAANAAAQTSDCKSDANCTSVQICAGHTCVPKQCQADWQCGAKAVCLPGVGVCMHAPWCDDCGVKPATGDGIDWREVKRKRDERIREMVDDAVKKAIAKIPPPPVPVVPEPIKGEDGKPCTVKQGTDGAVIDCPDGSRAIVTNGKDATEANFDLYRPFAGIGYEQMGPNSLMKSFGGVSASWDGLLLLVSLGHLTDFGEAGIGQRSTGLSIEAGLGWEAKWLELALMGYWWISAREELRDWDLQGAGAKLRAEFFPLAATIVPKLIGVYVDAGVGVTFTRGTALENAPTQGTFGLGFTVGHQF